MAFLRPVIFWVLSLTAFACSTDHTSGTADAAADAQHTAVADAGRGTGGSPPIAEAGAGGGGVDAGVWKFLGFARATADGRAVGARTSSGFRIYANDSNDPADVAFGLFWDPAVVTTAVVGGGCTLAFGTRTGALRRARRPAPSRDHRRAPIAASSR